MSDLRAGAGCSFVVKPHPAALRRPDGGFVDGALSVGGQFAVERDLQPGDELTVTIANADGEVIAQAVVEVGPIGFKPVKVKGLVIGTTRVHKAQPGGGMTAPADLLIFRVVVGRPPPGLNGASSATPAAAALCDPEAPFFAQPPRELLLPRVAARCPTRAKRRPARDPRARLRCLSAVAGRPSAPLRCDRQPCRSRRDRPSTRRRTTA